MRAHGTRDIIEILFRSCHLSRERERKRKRERECVLLVRKYIIINIIFYYCCCWCRDTIPFFKFFFFFLCFFFVDSFQVIYDFYSRIYIEYWWFSSLRPFLLITFFFFFYFSFLLRVGFCAHSCWYFIYLIRIEDRNQFFFYHFLYDFWSTLFLTKDFCFFFFFSFKIFLIRTLIFRRFELYLIVNYRNLSVPLVKLGFFLKYIFF